MDTRENLDKGPGVDLESGESPSEPANQPGTLLPPFVVRPHSLGLLPGIDPDRMNQLNDQMEVEEYLRKAARTG